MKRKLALKKVTLRDLDEQELQRAGGGPTDTHCFSQHTCPNNTCFECTVGNCGNTWVCESAGYTSCGDTCTGQYSCDNTYCWANSCVC